MTDTTVSDAPAVTDAPDTQPNTKLQIPVTKGKGYVTIDTATIPQHIYEAALAEGLKVLVTKGMSKITAANIPNETERAKEAMLIAEKNVKAINDGTLKLGRSKAAAGISGVVKTEAMRIARNLVKDQMKREGIKVSHVAASEITKVAKELLDADPDILVQAKKNLDERNKVPVATLIDVKKIKTDPAKVKAANDKAAKTKASGQLSAAKAGQVKAKAKGKGGAPANA